jgi:hypothetical protein
VINSPCYTAFWGRGDRGLSFSDSWEAPQIPRGGTKIIENFGKILKNFRTQILEHRTMIQLNKSSNCSIKGLKDLVCVGIKTLKKRVDIGVKNYQPSE